MRVISGSLRGRRLQEPQGFDIRPTTDQVKEALFNIIQFDIEGRRVLDLFAGTGQLGIEALSRGAADCVFLDQSRKAAALLEENLRRCELRARVQCCDSLSYLESCSPGSFDLIFIDPPYGLGLEQKALELIERFDILSKGGIMSIETRRETVLRLPPPEYGSSREYRYGRIKLSVISRAT